MSQKGCFITAGIVIGFTLLVAGLVYVRVVQVAKMPSEYVSSAKLIVNGREDLTSSETFDQDALTFFGTNIEILRSNEVRMRATDRVAALNPELTVCPIRLEISRPHQSAILSIVAKGSEPKYTVAYLNALLNEFINYLREMRAQSTDSTLANITNELLRLEKLLRSEESKLDAYQDSKADTLLQPELDALAETLKELHKLALTQTGTGLVETQRKITEFESRALSLEKTKNEKERIEGSVERIRKRYESMLTLLQDIDIDIRSIDHMAIMERASHAAELRPSLW